MEQEFCQSCGMPLSEDGVRGTERDGTQSADYCTCCYQDGAFTSEVTMAGMIEQCVPYMAGPQRTEAEARSMMQAFFPALKRWKQG